jgi:hypothetical protein
MSAPESIVQAQMEALLRRVAREQEMLSRKARDAAGEQARGIVARAREEARARTRQAAEEARQSLERALTDRRAALETAARQREQSLLRKLMDDAWATLPRELAANWQDPARRNEWCDAACAVARRIVMGSGAFTIELDADAPPDAADRAQRALANGDAAPAVTRVAGLGPGLRIRHGLACVDATTTGLLASRERIEAELLAELDALLEEHGRKLT